MWFRKKQPPVEVREVKKTVRKKRLTTTKPHQAVIVLMERHGDTVMSHGPFDNSEEAEFYVKLQKMEDEITTVIIRPHYPAALPMKTLRTERADASLYKK